MSSFSTMPYPAAQNQEREALVLSYLAHVTGMLRNLAASTHLEFEDLRQEAVLVIMHCLALKPEAARSLRPYIMRSVRNRMIDLIRQQTSAKQHYACSLDAPIQLENAESSGTFADLLPDPYAVEPLACVVLQEELEAFQTWLQNHKTARGTLRRQLWLSWQRFLKEEGQAA